MKLVIDIPEERFTDIQRIASVQLNRRTPTVEQIIAKGTEQKTAEWKIVGKTTLHYECSECGGAGDKLDKFCKHCGRKMKGE